MDSGGNEHGYWRGIAAAMGRSALPYWFAVAGLALGVGGVVRDEPLAGACGAVAGVTAGLLYLERYRAYRHQFEVLRDQLIAERVQAEGVAAELRDTISFLQNQIWERHAPAQLPHPPESPIAGVTLLPREPVPTARATTRPIDPASLVDVADDEKG
jgi:hypothetical protein